MPLLTELLAALSWTKQVTPTHPLIFKFNRIISSGSSLAMPLLTELLAALSWTKQVTPTHPLIFKFNRIILNKKSPLSL
jgi:hydroxyacyl-ACP dehydratase HTD2-like protein with hotdog domain